jgi:hypothetical protein
MNAISDILELYGKGAIELWRYLLYNVRGLLLAIIIADIVTDFNVDGGDLVDIDPDLCDLDRSRDIIFPSLDLRLRYDRIFP